MTMTDDVCGHPTEGGDGPPCQNPPGENGRCYIPAHNGEDKPAPQGRPSKYTDERARSAIDAASDGFSKAGCARAAGVGEQTLLDWLNEDHTVNGESFSEAFMRARHEGERTLVKGPLIDHPDAPGPDGPEVDGQHARFLLSTSFDYVKTEKQEVEDVTEGGFGANEVDDATREVVRDALADRYGTDDA